MRTRKSADLSHFGARAGQIGIDRRVPRQQNKRMNSSAGIHSSPAGLGAGLGHPFLRLFLCAALCCILASCDDASPKTCFDRAVLNTNMIADFASRGLLRQLESPSVKLTDVKTLATAPMKRKEVIDDKIAFVGQSLEKVRKLRQTDDTRDIVQASIALHEYVLPVYRNEYQQLAKLYDDGAAKEAMEALASAITVKYRAGFETLSDRLTTAGKAYAARHDIKVVWDVRTSPSH